jgi:uncharacterized membrane protein YeaQ/YmgE (transglycosylase-associated protein family)
VDVIAQLDLSFWSIVWYIVVGVIVGALARLIVPGRQNMNIWVTILLGVVAAIVGGIVWEWIFGEDQEGIAWIGSIIVAVILVWLYTRLAGGRART